MGFFDFVKDVGKGLAAPVLAPVQAIGDIAKGKNVLSSISGRGIQAMQGPGQLFTNMALTSKPVSNVLTSLGPMTFGATTRVKEFSEVGMKASSGESLSFSDQFKYARAGAYAGGAAIGGTYVAGAITPQNALLGSAAVKIATGKGNSGDVSLLSESFLPGSGSLVDTASDYYGNFKSGYESYQSPVVDTGGYSTFDSTVFPEALKKPQNIIPILLGVGVIAYFYFKGK